MKINWLSRLVGIQSDACRWSRHCKINCCRVEREPPARYSIATISQLTRIMESNARYELFMISLKVTVLAVGIGGTMGSLVRDLDLVWVPGIESSFPTHYLLFVAVCRIERCWASRACSLVICCIQHRSCQGMPILCGNDWVHVVIIFVATDIIGV